ncbi:MAG: 30S ribosomal protein S17 [Chlorobi bacterium]|jgi:small subunit ribosomal protein S17|nr:30S ribosomal protein S17 [Chlorobiota bacterium]
MGEQTIASLQEETAAVASQPKSRRKIRVGTVVSNKMQKSIVVAVVRRVRHPLYKKYFNKTKKYMAHDETNDCKVGDTVRIIETRPLSARKRWAVDAIVERAK